MIKLQEYKLIHILKRLNLGLITSFLLIACSTSKSNQIPIDSARNSEECQTIDHELGKTEICSQPQRIIVLGTNILELLLALEVEPIGYADYFSLPYSKFDKPKQQIPYIGERVTNKPVNVGTWSEPSLEAIVKLKPDLILGNVTANEDEYALLSQIAPTVLLKSRTIYNEWQQDLQKIAQILRRSPKAQKVIASNKQLLAATKKQLLPITRNYPQVLLLGSENLNQSVQLEGKNSFCGSLLETIGFQLVSLRELEKKPLSVRLISLETLPSLDKADLIIVGAWNRDFSNVENDLVEHQLGQVRKQWKENPIAQSMSASKQGRVYFTSSYLCRGLPGPIGTKIFLKQLRQKLLSQNKNNDK
ncbi:MAG: iron-siderophore ABC transporter substrate-binding protein [Cyanobacteria bacterium P01_A01_bin.68]